MNKILVFSFTNKYKLNISSDVMKELSHVDPFIVDCTSNEIGLRDTQKLLNHLHNSTYKYVIGVGIHSSNKDLIKIEKHTNNQFRNDPAIIGAPVSYSIGEFIFKPADKIVEIVESTKMGNSWCNMISFVIRHNLNEEHKPSLNAFIHIPNDSSKINNYAIIIQNIINRL